MREFSAPWITIFCSTICLTANLRSELPIAYSQSTEHAAPPPVFETRDLAAPRGTARPAAGPTLYSIGEPTDVEQEYLELLNRARLDPVGEGIRLRDTTDPEVTNAYHQENADGSVRWAVDTERFAAAMALFPRVPPLAFNSKLIIAARRHSRWMFDNVVQLHDEPGLTPSQRVGNSGYPWLAVAENIFSYAKRSYHGHAGFEVDWGYGLFGMQEPPGHRLNNHNEMFTEVGIGVILGTKSRVENGATLTVGPQIVTMDFGLPQSAVPLVTGVVYLDLNADGQYNAGEGLGAVRVEVSDSTFYAVTSDSGGYAVPTANGSRTVTFTADGLDVISRALTVTGGNNVKLDLALSYKSPSIVNSSNPLVNYDNPYRSTLVPGAAGYQLRTVKREPYGSSVEGAEQGTANLILNTSAAYQPLTMEVAAIEGTHCFHLAHPGDAQANPDVQYITLRPTLRAAFNTQWMFATMLGYATVGQVARAQVSTDGGFTWQDVWSQAGSGGKGETTFNRHVVSLAALAGLEFNARFIFSPGLSAYYPQTSKGVGLYLDETFFSGAERVEEIGLTDVSPAGSFTFRPAVEGSFAMSVRPKLGARILPYGASLSVTAVVGTIPPVVLLQRPVVGPNGRIRLDFSIVSGAAGAFQLERSDRFGGTWTVVPDAQLSMNTPTSYTYRFQPTTAQGYLRVLIP